MKPEHASALLSMKGTEGWRLVENHVRSRMEDVKSRLITAKTIEEVRELQGQHKALQSLLAEIDQTIQEGTE